MLYLHLLPYKDMFTVIDYWSSPKPHPSSSAEGYIFFLFVVMLLLTLCAGMRVLQQAREHVASANIHSKTGLHQPEVEEPPPPVFTASTPSHASSSPTTPINILDINGGCGQVGAVRLLGLGAIRCSVMVLI